MQQKNRIVSTEALFTALADRTRLRLLNLMGDKELCVCYLVEVLDAPQPTISRHLAYLRRKGLVIARRQGKWMHYRIATLGNPLAQQIVIDTLQWLADDKEMQRDRARLAQACCAPEKFVRLLGAPVPSATESTRRVDE